MPQMSPLNWLFYLFILLQLLFLLLDLFILSIY